MRRTGSFVSLLISLVTIDVLFLLAIDPCMFRLGSSTQHDSFTLPAVLTYPNSNDVFRSGALSLGSGGEVGVTKG